MKKLLLILLLFAFACSPAPETNVVTVIDRYYNPPIYFEDSVGGQRQATPFPTSGATYALALELSNGYIILEPVSQAVFEKFFVGDTGKLITTNGFRALDKISK